MTQECKYCRERKTITCIPPDTHLEDVRDIEDYTFLSSGRGISGMFTPIYLLKKEFHIIASIFYTPHVCMCKLGSLFRNKKDICISRLSDKPSCFSVEHSPKKISIYTSLCMFPRKYDTVSIRSWKLLDNMGDEIRGKDYSPLTHYFSYFSLWKSIFFGDHRETVWSKLPCLDTTKTLSASRIGDHTDIPSRDIVVTRFSTNILQALCITHCEWITPLSSTSCEDFRSIYRIFSCEKTMHTKSFSFFKWP